jgi:hypothetical protein
MKDLKELYEILLKYYTKQSKNYICNSIDNLFYSSKISHAEYVALKKHFKSQIPTANLHPEFYKHKMFRNPIQDTDAWFALDLKPILGKRVRVEFITKIISTL